MMKSAEDIVRSAKAEVENVSPQDAATEVAQGRAVFVDVRQAEEWQQGHTDGAIHASRGLLEFFADPTNPATRRGCNPINGSSSSAPPVRAPR
jgi:rhodanese-related sulfurtransferase